MMNRILKRPMFRMGGRSDDGIMSVRPGYAEGGSPLTTPDLFLQAQKIQQKPFLTLQDISKKYEDAVGSADLAAEFGDVEDLGGPGTFADESTGIAQFLRTPEGKEYFEKPLLDKRDKQIVERQNLGLSIPESIELPKDKTKNQLDKLKDIKVPQDPEKALLDVYADNKGIIDQVMGTSNEDTKRQLYLQLAKFGAGLAAQPGGDLVGAIGKAAADPLEGVGQVLASKQKAKKDIKMLALQKSFDDMKEPEQIKFIKAIQKEYGLNNFQEAFNLVTESKRSPAQKLAESKAIMDFAKERGISEPGFLKEMQKLEDAGGELEDLVGVFTRQDIELLPTDPDDRVNGEYYLKNTGEPFRFVDGIIYVPGDPEFTAKIKETKKT